MLQVQAYALIKLITKLVRDIQYKLQTEHIKNSEIEWEFIASHEDYLYNFIEFLKNKKIKKNAYILDAGCGISPILLLLQALNYKHLYGYDNQPEYIQKLKITQLNNNFQNPKGRLNLKVIDLYKADYGKYDIIYMYMPIKNPTQYKDLQKQIITKMKPGAYLMDFYAGVPTNLNTCEYNHDHYQRILRKI